MLRSAASLRVSKHEGMLTTLSPLIPAKAGTQGHTHHLSSRKRAAQESNHGRDPLREHDGVPMVPGSPLRYGRDDKPSARTGG